MEAGISTACFYPMDTAEALKRVGAMGAPVTELFLNTYSEIEDGYLARLLDIRREYGLRISSVHPFTSAMEGFLFASSYAGRLADGMRLYRRMFQVCRLLGADKLVFHGAHRPKMHGFPAMPDANYARNFRALAEAGREYGVALCHENVAYCVLATEADVERLGPLFGQHRAFVLDTKQVRRLGGDVIGMAKAMGGAVRQVHISDCAEGQTCLLPGSGSFDFGRLIARLRDAKYAGDLIIELYSDNFENEQQLAAAMRHIQGLIDAAAHRREE